MVFARFLSAVSERFAVFCPSNSSTRLSQDVSVISPPSKPGHLAVFHSDAERSQLISDAFHSSAEPSKPIWGQGNGWMYSPLALFGLAACSSDGSRSYPNIADPISEGSAGVGGKKGASAGQGGGGMHVAGAAGNDGVGGAAAGSAAAVGGSGGAGGSSGVKPVDEDGDGFKSDVDCDDNDPSTFPLKDDQTLNIKQDTTICPGIYKRVRLNIEAVNGITVKGAGVIVDADGVKIKDEGDTHGIVHFKNAHNVDFSGFHIKNYGDWYTAIRMDGSHSNVLHDLNISDMFEYYGGIIGKVVSGIWALNSSNNSIINANIIGKGASISFHGGSANYIGDCSIDSSPKTTGVLDAAIMFADSFNGKVENCTLNGAGILTSLGANGLIVSSTNISNAPAGVYLAGDSAQILNNVIHYSVVGAELSGDSLVLSGNDLRYNNECYKINSGSIDNTVSDNQCN